MQSMKTQGLSAGTSDAIFARRLREVRESSGMTQQQLADLMARAGGKIHRSTVGKIENGDRPVTIGEAIQIAGILGVPLDDLVAEPIDDTEAGRERAARVQAQIRFRNLMHEWDERVRQLADADELLEITLRKLEDAWKQLLRAGGEMPVVPYHRDDGTVVTASMFDELPSIVRHRLSPEDDPQ